MSYNFILTSFEIILPQPLLKKLKAFLAFNFVCYLYLQNFSLSLSELSF